ncbi:MAG: FtsW/RodA/SpoVE family cell cycle protein [Lachnospiraceae bacterium]|nr:FtsW/RodA/SpoVE family cell cycle protein [Lachnospiraceae bacterium]
MHAFIDSLKTFLDSSPELAESFLVLVRILFPILSLLILSGAFVSLFSLPKQKEVFAHFVLPDRGISFPIHHLECLIGRSRSADIALSSSTVSRIHAVVSGDGCGNWTVNDIDSMQGTFVNDKQVTDRPVPLHFGDELRVGEIRLTFTGVDAEEQTTVLRKRRVRPLPPWTSLLLLTILQVTLCIQLLIAKNASAAHRIFPVFALYTLLMWAYFVGMKLMKVNGFELEIIAFYLTTLCLSVTTTCNWTLLPKQFLSIVLGILFMFVIGRLLRNPGTARRCRWFMAAFAILLMSSAILLADAKNGASNWIHIFGFSFQPSEVAKLCYVFAGSATLDRLFRKRNLTLFVALSMFMMLCLAYMNDFGTAAVFFVTFLVISFLRSGDFATFVLFCAGAVSAGVLALIAKPYIWARFSTWRHALEYSSAEGYQQARTLAAIASGGLLGMGPGNGFLKRVAASDTDLVFGLLCEEWGLLTAVLAVLCILVLSAFAIRSAISCRSTFYMIAACSATTMLVFQTALNVFGCTDLLPLTGVTFPFVSNGGSSMILSWGLLAFLKAADTRPGASFVYRAADLRLRRLFPRLVDHPSSENDEDDEDDEDGREEAET